MKAEGYSFNGLFKKYRLKAEFETLSELGMALAEKGFIYEDSIFSHWNKGDRLPNREILLALVEIFIERGSIKSIQEVNKLLVSANQGYVTDQEIKRTQFKNLHSAPFQVPNEIAHFTGREPFIQQFTERVSRHGIFLIYGPSGIGKTALAIHVGHKLKHLFPDGVLWYKVDTTNSMDILLSIAYTFHENISPIQNLEARASVVRSLLANKKILLILDNVEKDNNIGVLLPNSLSCIILTSKHNNISLDVSYENIPIHSFTQKEALTLFTKILSAEYVKKHQDSIINIGNKVGNLPLALHLYAKQLAMTNQSPKSLLQSIEQSKISLKELSYEDKNLYVSIDISFQSLDQKIKKIFLSLGIFEGRDFSLAAVAAMNAIKTAETFRILQKLINASLLEKSTKNRYRLHPVIKQYIRKNIQISTYTKTATQYYAKFLEKNKRKNTLFYNTKNIYPEKENILFILEQCYKQKLYQEIVSVWKNLGLFFTQTGEWEKVIYYGEKIYNAVKKNNDYYNYNHVRYTIDILTRIYYFQGDTKRVQELITEEMQVANYLQDEYLIQFSRQRLGKIYQCVEKFNESLELLNESLKTIKKYNDIEQLPWTYKFIGEAYLFKKRYAKAMDNFKQAFQIVNKTRDIVLLAVISSTIGSMYYAEKQYSKAESYLMEGIKLEEKYGVRMGIRVLNNLALALIAKEHEEIQKAEKYLLQAKQENQYLNIGSNADKMYAIVFMLKEKLLKAGYYIFE